MKLTRFQTDKRLWIGASLILFVFSLWIPWVPPILERYPVVSPVRLASIMWDLGHRYHFDSHGPHTAGEWVVAYLRSTYFFLSAGDLLNCYRLGAPRYRRDSASDAVYKKKEQNARGLA